MEFVESVCLFFPLLNDREFLPNFSELLIEAKKCLSAKNSRMNVALRLVQLKQVGSSWHAFFILVNCVQMVASNA